MDRLLHDPQILNQAVVILPFSFRPNGTSAIDADETKGLGVTVTRTGVGTFLVTLDDITYDFISCIVSMQKATAADIVPQIVGAIDVSAKTFSIKTLAVATPTDVSSSANSRVHGLCFLRNSNVQ